MPSKKMVDGIAGAKSWHECVSYSYLTLIARRPSFANGHFIKAIIIIIGAFSHLFAVHLNQGIL